MHKVAFTLTASLALISFSSFADSTDSSYASNPIVIKAQQQYDNLVQQTEKKAQQKQAQQQQQLLQMQQQLKASTPTNPAGQQAITPPPKGSINVPPSGVATTSPAQQQSTNNSNWTKPNPLANPAPSPYATPAPNPWAPTKSPSNTPNTTQQPASSGTSNMYLPPASSVNNH
jgi:hypothetical protein